MEQYALPIANLIEQLSKLPGIGRKNCSKTCILYIRDGRSRSRKTIKIHN